MMNKAINLAKNALEKAGDFGVRSSATYLKILGAIGWGLSCFAQVGAIMTNKEIPNKEKKFLVPQEILDGVVNVSLFLLITGQIHKLGRVAFLKGKIRTADFKDLADDAFSKTVNMLSSEEDFEKAFNKIKSNFKDPQKIENFDKSFGGVTTFISFIGSSISANIVTPIVRNIFASKFQKKLHNEESNKLDVTSTAPNMPKSPEFTSNIKPNSVKRDYFAMIKAGQGGMKV